MQNGKRTLHNLCISYRKFGLHKLYTTYAKRCPTPVCVSCVQLLGSLHNLCTGLHNLQEWVLRKLCTSYANLVVTTTRHRGGDACMGPRRGGRAGGRKKEKVSEVFLAGGGGQGTSTRSEAKILGNP